MLNSHKELSSFNMKKTIGYQHTSVKANSGNHIDYKCGENEIDFKEKQILITKLISENIITIPYIKSKMLGYKISLGDIKGKDCSIQLKIIILKGLRENLNTLINHITNQKLEKIRINKLSFEANLFKDTQYFINSKIKRDHKKNSSTVSHNFKKNLLFKSPSFHTLVSNQSTTDGRLEEEKFLEKLKIGIEEQEEKLIEIKKFRNNLIIEWDDIKDDLCFFKNQLKEKQNKNKELTNKIEDIKDFISKLSKKKRGTLSYSKNNNLTTMTTGREDFDPYNLNISKVNVSFIDDVTNLWGRFLQKFKKEKKDNILDGIDNTQRK